MITEKLSSSALELTPEDIRNHLESRYTALGRVPDIPDFERFIGVFLSHTPVEPVVSGLKATNITTTGATLNAKVNPGSVATEVVFEYGTSHTYGHTFRADQSPVECHSETDVSVTITGLDPSTTYYFRVKAENPKGVIFSDDNNFTTAIAGIGAVTDIDGNTYQIMLIGNQLWIGENLKTTKYNDGSDIAHIPGDTEWINFTGGAYCFYNNDIDNKSFYGALYNWYAVETGKLCPEGWHVPTQTEWAELENYLGGSDVAGDKMKSVTGWYSPNSGATNSSSFSALPGGSRREYGFSTEKSGYWWSATETSSSSAYGRCLHYDSSSFIVTGGMKTYGFSVRCIKDE
jgi:uncharacterized protein (TIGR02145 family)